MLTHFLVKITFLLQACVLTSCYTAQNSLEQYAVVSQILTGYQKTFRPDSKVNVSISFKLNQIIGLNEKTSIMTSGFLLKLDWKDPRLAWNLTEHNIDRIVLPASSIWLPDLFIINTAEANGFINIPAQSLALINYDGTVYLAVSLSLLNTRCDMNIQNFPYDIQNCPIVVGSWQNDDSMINFTSSDNLDTSSYISNPIWEFYGFSLNYSFTGSRFAGNLTGTDLAFQFTMVRLPAIYLLNNVFPCLILNAVILLAFFMPFPQQSALSDF